MHDPGRDRTSLSFREELYLLWPVKKSSDLVEFHQTDLGKEKMLL
jgi:hypothetical protein